MEMDVLLKLIKSAINMESDAAFNYKHAALNSKDVRAREMFMQFSRDEEKHRRMLVYVLEKCYLQNGFFEIPELGLPTGYSRGGCSPVYSKQLVELIDEPLPVWETVNKFIDMEKKAIIRYDEMAGEKLIINTDKLFMSLAAWEKKHLEALEIQKKEFGVQSEKQL